MPTNFNTPDLHATLWLAPCVDLTSCHLHLLPKVTVAWAGVTCAHPHALNLARCRTSFADNCVEAALHAHSVYDDTAWRLYRVTHRRRRLDIEYRGREKQRTVLSAEIQLTCALCGPAACRSAGCQSARLT